jgi:RNA polymerase sigma-70 factor (ECF subfamily)
LIFLISKDNQNAFEQLYKKMKSQVYGLALAILKNRYDAEDAMQTVFLRVWDRAEQYRPGTDAELWVMKITRNLALDRLRSRKNTADIMDYTELRESGDAYTGSLDKIVLQSLLEKLECTERQIVILHSVGGYTHKEIAKIVRKPYATVRWKYRNAMKKLQALLKREDYHESNTQFAENSGKSA